MINSMRNPARIATLAAQISRSLMGTARMSKTTAKPRTRRREPIITSKRSGTRRKHRRAYIRPNNSPTPIDATRFVSMAHDRSILASLSSVIDTSVDKTNVHLATWQVISVKR